MTALHDLYKDLHQHPELSFAETRTAGVIAGELRRIGLDVHEGVGRTGVVGVLSRGEGPRVLLRADFDALPVQEKTGVAVLEPTIGTGVRALTTAALEWLNAK